MIDFARISAELDAGLDDEARTRVSARRERENRAEATSEKIEATFERLVSNDGGRTTSVWRSWTKPVTMRIEEQEGTDGETYEVLAFIGAVTGYERFRLDEDLARMLGDPEERRERPDWAICAGSVRYDACRVSMADVEAYVRRTRPHLFETAASPSP